MILPNALAIEVPYEAFRHLNPTKIKPFKEAFKMKYERRMREQESIAYMSGIYVLNAINSTFGKGKFPEKPIEFFKFNDNKMDENKELTEEEKEMYRKKLVASLQSMQYSHERYERETNKDA